ncbi:MAG: YbaB/EbfC family nucleoid-associated protein [Acidobacteria bacterium]|nr:YbaB/EbfC family nucleoid-associated protein [Acidobacteriota bacterium]
MPRPPAIHASRRFSISLVARSSIRARTRPAIQHAAVHFKGRATMNIRQLMKQAQQMQEKMQRELAELVVESSVGGGLVTVKMSGHKHLVSVHIDPEVIDPNDVSMLEDLVLAAVNEAARKVDEALQGRMGSLASGLPGVF